MERLSFGPDAARSRPAEPLLVGTTIAPLTEPIAGGAPFQAACFRIEAGGRIARHPATLPQLLAVVEGSGSVSGGDGKRQPIRAGQAVVWEAGEEHETTTDAGLTAIIIEGEGLRPFVPR